MVDIFSISIKYFLKIIIAREHAHEHYSELKHLAKSGNLYNIKVKLHF